MRAGAATGFLPDDDGDAVAATTLMGCAAAFFFVAFGAVFFFDVDDDFFGAAFAFFAGVVVFFAGFAADFFAGFFFDATGPPAIRCAQRLAAMTSISTRTSRGSRATCTVERAGNGCSVEKRAAYSSLTLAKSLRSERKIVVLTTSE